MKKNICLLALSFCSLMAVNAQGGFQQNGSSLYYNNGNVGIGDMYPSQN